MALGKGNRSQSDREIRRTPSRTLDEGQTVLCKGDLGSQSLLSRKGVRALKGSGAQGKEEKLPKSRPNHHLSESAPMATPKTKQEAELCFIMAQECFSLLKTSGVTHFLYLIPFALFIPASLHLPFELTQPRICAVLSFYLFIKLTCLGHLPKEVTCFLTPSYTVS